MSLKKIKAVIVDDELRALQLNTNLINQYCPQVSIVGIYDTIQGAYDGILQHKPELVFLDIDMPPYTGFDLLKKLDPMTFEIIFITAFDHYAIDAIRFSALDYLMKPVRIEELEKAVMRAMKKMEMRISQPTIQPIDQTKEISKLVIHSHKGTEVLNIKEIYYFEALGSYTEFHSISAKTLSSKSFRDYEEMFQNHNFFRIHRSFMVNLAYVKSVDKSDGSQVVLENNVLLPLAVRRKQEFYERLVFITK